MPSLARRNLLHDRVRLVVTLTGIVFAVVLSAVQLGLFVGFTRATADIITNSDADVWVVPSGATHMETGRPFSERRLYQALATPGVGSVQKHIIEFGQWRLPDGANESVMLIGVEPRTDMGQPWNLTAGSIADLERPDAIIVDELYLEKLGVTHLGQAVEIGGRRARVVGFTRGIRTFTTAPPVFTSFKNAQGYANLREADTRFLLVKAGPGVSPAELAERLNGRLEDVEVLTTSAWATRQTNYWMFGTGAGVTVLIAAALGLIVGVVVVAQTIYASTIDHIREYGTLKAMGATNGYLYRVITEQAALSALAGYGAAIVIAVAVSQGSLQGTTAIVIEWPLALGLFVLTLGMCLAASFVSINKVTRLDPALVFRG